MNLAGKFLGVAIVAMAGCAGSALSQGYAVGEWSIVDQGTGSTCRITLSNQFSRRANAFRVYAQGGARCFDPRFQGVAFWALRDATVYIIDGFGKEVYKMDAQGPNFFQGGGQMMRRRGF